MLRLRSTASEFRTPTTGFESSLGLSSSAGFCRTATIGGMFAALENGSAQEDVRPHAFELLAESAGKPTAGSSLRYPPFSTTAAVGVVRVLSVNPTSGVTTS